MVPGPGFLDDHLAAPEGRSFFRFLLVRGAENMVPQTGCDPEIYVWELMMNDVMSPQLPIPGILEMEMMMDMVKSPVKDKSGCYGCHETQDEMDLQVVDEGPYATEKSCHQKPGHRD
jgi:hypothetical protein